MKRRSFISAAIATALAPLLSKFACAQSKRKPTTLSMLRNQKVSTRLYRNVRTDEAVQRVLDTARWPPNKRIIGAGMVTLSWFWADKENAVDALARIVKTEGGTASVYEDKRGNIVFEGNQS